MVIFVPDIRCECREQYRIIPLDIRNFHYWNLVINIFTRYKIIVSIVCLNRYVIWWPLQFLHFDWNLKRQLLVSWFIKEQLHQPFIFLSFSSFLVAVSNTVQRQTSWSHGLHSDLHKWLISDARLDLTFIAIEVADSGEPCRTVFSRNLPVSPLLNSSRFAWEIVFCLFYLSVASKVLSVISVIHKLLLLVIWLRCSEIYCTMYNPCHTENNLP